MEVLMPQLGETVSEGKVLTWFKAVGDQVKAGDNLFEIETDKVTMEIQSLETGVLSEIRVPVGIVAPVGAIVAVIGNGGSAAAPSPAAQSPAPAAPPPPAPKAAAPAPVPAAPTPAPAPRAPNSPLDPHFEVRTPVEELWTGDDREWREGDAARPAPRRRVRHRSRRRPRLRAQWPHRGRRYQDRAARGACTRRPVRHRRKFWRSTRMFRIRKSRSTACGRPSPRASSRRRRRSRISISSPTSTSAR